MPYRLFEKKILGKRKWCIENKQTGKITCFSSPEKRKVGIKIRYAIEKGWRPKK